MAQEKYLNSENVKVFPSARRWKSDVNARLLTEASLAGIVNNLIDKVGFIISKIDDFDETAEFKFNINGYVFTVENSAKIFELFDNSEGNKIYANIITVNEGRYTELFGIDDEQISGETLSGTSLYEGVIFTNTPYSISEADKKVYSLLLFEWDAIENKWKPNNKGRFKFDSDSLDIEIDGGEI